MNNSHELASKACRFTNALRPIVYTPDSPYIARERIMLNLRQCALSTAAMCFFATPAAQAQTADAPGSEDHPIVTRYEGSYIDEYEVRSYDSFRLALGPAGWNQDGVKVPAKQANLEGRVTRILYRGPQERASLEILRNYQSALEGAGFEPLYTCGSDCGNNFVFLLYGPTEMRIWSDAVERYLGEHHGIDAGRMRSEGVGFLAPVSTNDTPDGRAKNRRVELVKT
jgi:hypothetical protein